VTALVLDTEAFIWWDENDPRLGGNARAAIENASVVYVSAASVWEIAIKASIGKLATRRRATLAVEQAGFDELPITFDHADAVRSLPHHHRDPFDRLIIAAARVEGCAVLTSDGQFARYDVEVVDARK